MKENYSPNTNVPACYLFLKKDEKIFLLRRFNTGFMDGFYTTIAGHVDAGETFSQAVVREAEEEAGIIVKQDDVKMVHTMHRKKQSETFNERVDIFFTVENWEGELRNTEPHKCDDMQWFDANNLPENMVPYVQHAIECIEKNMPYSEFGWEK
ncbi:NUDIX domain-containing protein [Candidatus Gracilibacteria bacterium]|nr:NUDIX domain-containing protein [Candidatus Gracilibacteria bacterium]